MTRNERIREKCAAVRATLMARRKWVQVTIAPGFVCDAPMVALHPLDDHKILNALTEIEAETRGERTGL